MDGQIARMEPVGAAFVHILDPHYPPHLHTIYDPPAFLFLQGSIAPQDAAGIAIVGTRDPSAYGKRMAEAFASALAARGITAVSYTHLRAHETVLDLVCRLLLEKKKEHHETRP